MQTFVCSDLLEIKKVEGDGQQWKGTIGMIHDQSWAVILDYDDI